MNPKPSRILLLKGHSAGIGDILRSSAAWRVLKDAFPGAELHLMLLSREPGYPSEELIREHHLLAGFSVIDKRTGERGGWKKFWSSVGGAASKIRPDLVVDFEPSGLRTTLVARWCAWKFGARTVGINSVPGRGLLYCSSSMGPKKFAAKRNLPEPLEYTNRDFVVLSALGLERNGAAIELRETLAGSEFRRQLRTSHGIDPSAPLLGVNVGCGTSDAAGRRPNLELLSELVGALQKEHGMTALLAGAPFEKEINREFCAVHQKHSRPAMLDLAGETSISSLTGLINACELFISGDTGPYHMAVAMHVPTLAIFTWPNPVAYHVHPWVRCVVANAMENLPALRNAAEELISWAKSDSRPTGSG
jgi:ADP-heptose:LPS heptosyltransferase